MEDKVGVKNHQDPQRTYFHHGGGVCFLGLYTVRKMDPILRSIQRMLQTQLSMAHQFTLRQL